MNNTPPGFPKLRVEPLHTVHDSLITQWRKEDRPFAKAKLREWFNNPIQIAGTTVVIPADGEIGTDWSMQNGEKL